MVESNANGGPSGGGAAPPVTTSRSQSVNLVMARSYGNDCFHRVIPQLVAINRPPPPPPPSKILLHCVIESQRLFLGDDVLRSGVGERADPLPANGRSPPPNTPSSADGGVILIGVVVGEQLLDCSMRSGAAFDMSLSDALLV